MLQACSSAREFDERFEELLADERLQGKSSRLVAIERINAELQ